MAENEKKKKGGIGKWFRELKSEFKKIVWPSGKQLKNNTVIVIVVVLIITAIIFAFDSGFKALVGLVVPSISTTQTADTGDDGLTEDDGADADSETNTDSESGTESTGDGTATDTTSSAQ